jgi:hypothetical protein
MKSISAIFLAILALFLVNSCDKLESPYLNLPEVVDTAACPVPDFPAVAEHQKRVLLEDYTGHTCPNCPTAGKLARDLKEQYPDQLVVMAVHAGWFARTYPESGIPQIYDYDFRTTSGTDWDAFFGNGNAGNPNGLVNRLKVNNKYVLRPNEWAGVISSALAVEPSMDLQLIVDYDPSDRKICAHTKAYFLQTLDRNLKLEAVIIEDSIVATQKNNDASIGEVGDILDFVHMHVVRGTLNGTWGSTLATVGTANPATAIKTLQSVLPADCKPKNCHIVVFVFDEDTKEVLQAAETPLVE